MRVAYYSGPDGRQREALMHCVAPAESLPCPSISEVFSALDRGQAERGFVPVEDSYSGGVTETYDLILQSDVSVTGECIYPVSTDESATRYFVLSPGAWLPGAEPAEGPGKTTLVFAVDHRPGALVRALGYFARQQVNMTRLESRPSRRRPWEYFFIVDVDGHFQEPKVRTAIRELTRLSPSVRVLGSYRAQVLPEAVPDSAAENEAP